MPNVIEVKNVSKSFKTYETKKKGFMASLRRKYYIKKALTNISLNIPEGSITALIGRNGSGKSTLIKILTGILYPDSGTVSVMGLNPWEYRMKIAKEIGVVLGAHGQLYWNLPAYDTFKFMSHIYSIDQGDFEKRLKHFIGILNLENVYKKPVRTMSLGEQMKCNFVASVLHMPKIVFLDEPTIGVDLSSKAALRTAMLEMRKEYKTTFLLTTHIVEDISIAESILMLEKGKLVFEGSRKKLEHIFGDKRIVELQFDESTNPRLEHYGKILYQGKGYASIEVKPGLLKDRKFIKILNKDYIIDYKVSELSLTSILSKLYENLDRKIGGKRETH
jgi:ABC-2 type transport system ATP-binding protein